MQESQIENYLFREARKRGALPFKFISPGNRGVPDRLLCFPHGVHVFVETKAPDEQLREQQVKRKKELEARGHYVRKVDSKKDVDRLMEEAMEWIINHMNTKSSV